MQLRTIRDTLRALPRNDTEAATADTLCARQGYVLVELTPYGARVYRKRASEGEKRARGR